MAQPGPHGHHPPQQAVVRAVAEKVQMQLPGVWLRDRTHRGGGAGLAPRDLSAAVVCSYKGTVECRA